MRYVNCKYISGHPILSLHKNYEGFKNDMSNHNMKKYDKDWSVPIESKNEVVNYIKIHHREYELNCKQEKKIPSQVLLS